MRAAWSAWRVLRDMVDGFVRHDGVSSAAGIAFYTVFSLAPTLIFVIAVAGAIYGEQAVRGELAEQISKWVGDEGAKQVEALVQNANKPRSGLLATLVGVGTLLVGATGAFGQLAAAMNAVWEVKAKRVTHGLWIFVRTRLIAVAMILGISLLLLVSILASTMLAGVQATLQDAIPGWIGGARAWNLAFSLAISTLLFWVMYVSLPATKVRWADALAGAGVAALLFWLGRLGVGQYLRLTGLASVYGAAGSIIVILVWVYYSTMIVLVGAEFARAFGAERAKWRGSGAKPAQANTPPTQAGGA